MASFAIIFSIRLIVVVLGIALLAFGPLSISLNFFMAWVFLLCGESLFLNHFRTLADALGSAEPDAWEVFRRPVFFVNLVLALALQGGSLLLILTLFSRNLGELWACIMTLCTWVSSRYILWLIKTAYRMRAGTALSLF